MENINKDYALIQSKVLIGDSLSGDRSKFFDKNPSKYLLGNHFRSKILFNCSDELVFGQILMKYEVQKQKTNVEIFKELKIFITPPDLILERIIQIGSVEVFTIIGFCMGRTVYLNPENNGNIIFVGARLNSEYSKGTHILSEHKL